MKLIIKRKKHSEVSRRRIWKARLFNTLTMLGILIVTVVFTEALRAMHFGNQSLIMVYFLSVLIISRVTSGYIYSLIATIASTLVFDFLITEPRLAFSFTIGSPITLVSMLVATFITSTVTMRMKTQAQLAREREHRAQLLFEINQKLLAARDAETIIQLTTEYLIAHLKRSVVFYTKDPFQSGVESYNQTPYDSGDPEIFHAEAEQLKIRDIFGGVLDTMDQPSPETADVPVYYVSMISKGHLLGVVGIDCGSRPLTESNLTLVQMIIGQVTPALELQYMADEQNRILVDAEKEKMRSTLLRAISHDLRTPLTSILGAGSTILEQRDMAPEVQESLARDIKENAQWLIRMVENILTITKISQETMKLSKTLEAAEEVIAQSVSIVRKRFPDCKIRVKVPDELLMAPMDATLITQVIINLLENSVKNAPSGSQILVSLERERNYAKFVIADNGRGLPVQILDNLFEVDYPKKIEIVDSTRGIGIGLSICYTIVKAHGGSIAGHNKKEGGAVFSFLLPLKEDTPDHE